MTLESAGYCKVFSEQTVSLAHPSKEKKKKKAVVEEQEEDRGNKTAVGVESAN